MKIYFILIAALLFNAAANILMKQSANAAGGKAASIAQKILSPSGVYFLIGLACFGMALIFYRWALESMNLSIAYPIMTALGYAIVILFSFFFFKEALNVKQVVGFVLILAGVFLVAQQGSAATRAEARIDGSLPAAADKQDNE